MLRIQRTIISLQLKFLSLLVVVLVVDMGEMMEQVAGVLVV
jgi:hypothetical protein